jgi:hypothetical protein
MQTLQLKVFPIQGANRDVHAACSSLAMLSRPMCPAGASGDSFFVDDWRLRLPRRRIRPRRLALPTGEWRGQGSKLSRGEIPCDRLPPLQWMVTKRLGAKSAYVGSVSSLNCLTTAPLSRRGLGCGGLTRQRWLSSAANPGRPSAGTPSERARIRACRARIRSDPQGAMHGDGSYGAACRRERSGHFHQVSARFA